MAYLFATGKIRVLEKRLLDKIDIERMVGAESFEKAFQVLNNTDFSDNLLHLQPHDFEKAISRDMTQKRDLIKNISSNKHLFHYLFLKYDLHNIKVFLKSRLLNDKNYLKKIIPFGIIDPGKIEEYIFLENKKALPVGSLKDSLDRVLENVSLETVDALCDREYFQLLLYKAKKINNKFITNLAILEIDFANLKIALRTKKDVEKLHIPGGNISVDKLKEICLQREDGVIKYLKSRLVRSELKLFEEYFKEKKLWQLERSYDNLLINFLKRTRKVTAGPCVVVAYVVVKEIAFRNIRLIMTAKINGVPTAIIKTRVRDTY